MSPLGKCLKRIQVLRYRIPGFEVFDSPGINNLGSLCSLETFGPLPQGIIYTLVRATCQTFLLTEVPNFHRKIVNSFYILSFSACNCLKLGYLKDL